MHKYQLKDFVEHSGGGTQYDILQSVLEELPKLDVDKGPWLAGGAVRRIIAGEKLDSDFDIFFAGEEQFQLWCRSFVLKQWQLVKETDHHVTYQKEDKIVQLINIRFFNSPQEINDWFDYTICQAITDGMILFVGEYTLWDIARKRLAINNVHYAVSTMRRMLKYANQGYTACAGTMATLFQFVVEDPTLINENIEYVD